MAPPVVHGAAAPASSSALLRRPNAAACRVTLVLVWRVIKDALADVLVAGVVSFLWRRLVMQGVRTSASHLPVADQE